jgi:hemolysin III
MKIPDYPEYSRRERIADGALHAVGVVCAIVGATALMVHALKALTTGQNLALAVYSFGLVGMFCASALYHMTPWKNLRPYLRRVDHATIYLKIAATYTPLVMLVGSISSFIVLGLVWLLAFFGMIQKLFFWHRPGRFGPALYLIMGWLSVFLIWSSATVLPWISTGLIATGGLLYTFGVVFFSWESLRFSLAIWHGFVVAASACFFVAIVVGFSQIAV